MPGDYGFDPLGLWTANTEYQGWIEEAELLHGRWAMLAVVGVLVPEILSVCGADVGEPVWWKVRAHVCRGLDVRSSSCISAQFRISNKSVERTRQHALVL